MPGGIYLIQGDGSLVMMEEKAYDSEDLLQGLLAEYPNLLAGDQVDGDEPRRWLLISREMSLASEEEGSGRWSVDRLFLDQDAIPTIVETEVVEIPIEPLVQRNPINVRRGKRGT